MIETVLSQTNESLWLRMKLPAMSSSWPPDPRPYIESTYIWSCYHNGCSEQNRSLSMQLSRFRKRKVDTAILLLLLKFQNFSKDPHFPFSSVARKAWSRIISSSCEASIAQLGYYRLCKQTKTRYFLVRHSLQSRLFTLVTTIKSCGH